MRNLEGLIKKLEGLDDFDIEIHTPHQTCQSCDKKVSSTQLTIEPFGDEIHGSQDWEFMCGPCYAQACQDI